MILNIFMSTDIVWAYANSGDSSHVGTDTRSVPTCGHQTTPCIIDGFAGKVGICRYDVVFLLLFAADILPVPALAEGGWHGLGWWPIPV